MSPCSDFVEKTCWGKFPMLKRMSLFQCPIAHALDPHSVRIGRISVMLDLTSRT